MARDSRYYRQEEYRRPPRRDNQGALNAIGTVVKWVVIILLVMLFVSMARRSYDIGYSVFSEKAMAASGEGKEVSVTITDSMSVDDIGRLLQQNGLIRDGSIFRWQERFSSYHGDLKPGTYTLSTEMSPQEIIKTLAGADDGSSGGSASTESVREGASAVSTEAPVSNAAN